MHQPALDLCFAFCVRMRCEVFGKFLLPHVILSGKFHSLTKATGNRGEKEFMSILHIANTNNDRKHPHLNRTDHPSQRICTVGSVVSLSKHSALDVCTLSQFDPLQLSASPLSSWMTRSFQIVPSSPCLLTQFHTSSPL